MDPSAEIVDELVAGTTIRWSDNVLTFEFARSVWDSDEKKQAARTLIHRCTALFLEKYPGGES